jgi:CHAD domain-containing protein
MGARFLAEATMQTSFPPSLLFAAGSFDAGRRVRGGDIGNPLGAHLAKVARAVAAGVRHRRARAARGKQEPVHQIRVALKRTRALLFLVRPLFPKRTYEKLLRRLRRAARRLALVRDLVVAQTLLAHLAATSRHRRARKSCQRALGGFAHSSDPAAGELARALCEVGEATVEVTRRLALLRRRRTPGLQGVVWQRAVRSWKAAHRALRRARKDDAASFHRLRKRVKRLFYELEILRPWSSKKLARLRTRLRRFGGKLGDQQDLAVLRGILKNDPRRFGGRKSVRRLIRLLDRRAGKLGRRNLRAGRDLFRRSKGEFHECRL